MTRKSSQAKQPRPTGNRPANVASAPDLNGTGRLWPALVLIVVGIAVYANSVWGVFLFDDAYAIVDNLRIRQLFPVERWMATERPVVELSLAVNYAVGKLNVTGYHVFNVAVHIAAALTLFGLVWRTVTHCQSRGRKPTDTVIVTRIAPGALFAFAVALIWLVHPLQTESVTYVIQRAESLMGLFYLLTMYLFVRGAGSARSWRWYAAAVVVCALGMACKAVMATAPVMPVGQTLLPEDHPVRRPDPSVPVPDKDWAKLPRRAQTGQLDRAAFVYDAARDCYYCPQGWMLTLLQTKTKERGTSESSV